MSIFDYLYDVYLKFAADIKEIDDLCMLNDLTFESGHVPDYSVIPTQRFYLLRYAFAYAYEYKCMFGKLFEVAELGDSISVLSLGCGAIQDYWALTEVISESSRDMRVSYTGVDCIDWVDKFDVRVVDNVEFAQADIIDYFRGIFATDADVIIFPKSISEFNGSYFDALLAELEKVVFTKERFFILVSLRADDYNKGRDIEKSKKIAEAVERGGYTCHSGLEGYYCYKECSGIKKLDRKFDYPNDAIALINSLRERCGKFSAGDCDNDCTSSLQRSPILKSGQVNFQILEFTRAVK